MAVEPWWRWRWDTRQVADVSMPLRSIVRWRRGWLTVYRFETDSGVQWWLYGPFHLALGFAYEKSFSETSAINLELYECVECSRKSGAPTLCERCLRARNIAGSSWKGPLPRHMQN
jgi:hypothetical protein